MQTFSYSSGSWLLDKSLTLLLLLLYVLWVYNYCCLQQRILKGNIFVQFFVFRNSVLYWKMKPCADRQKLVFMLNRICEINLLLGDILKAFFWLFFVGWRASMPISTNRVPSSILSRILPYWEEKFTCKPWYLEYRLVLQFCSWERRFRYHIALGVILLSYVIKPLTKLKNCFVAYSASLTVLTK